MKQYKLMLLAHPNLEENTVMKSVDEVLGAKEHTKDYEGCRQLKYEIKGNLKAHYVAVDLELDKKEVKELTEKLDTDERFIRYLLVQKAEGVSNE